MKKALLMVFILTILISCKSEEEFNTISVTHADAARTSSTITLTNKNELPRIEPIIDLFFPIEQSTYQIRFISFLKDNENNNYTRVTPIESENCLLDEQCDISNFVYFVWSSYQEIEDCVGEYCKIGTVCTLVDDTQTLLYSAQWRSESTVPKNLPEYCLIGNSEGNTLYDCTENLAGQNHELAQTSIFQSLSNETSSGVDICF